MKAPIGQVIAPGPTTGDLVVDTLGKWLPRLVATAVELQSSPFARVTERVLHDALARLRRVRLLRATTVAVWIDGEPVRTPSLVDRCLHIEDDEYPVILIRFSVNDLGWDELESIAESLTLLIGQSSAAESLRLAALALGRGLADDWREPTDAELASFRVSTERIAEITAGLRDARIDHLKFSLVPAVACLAGLDAARQVEVANPEHRDELVSLLGSIVEADFATRLVAAAENAVGPDDLRRELELPLAQSNRALRGALRDPRRQPIHFVDEHESVFRSFVAQARDELLDVIRVHFLSEFTSVGDLSRYPELRLLPRLEPDPAWLDDFELPEQETMQARLTQWLEANKIPSRAAETESAPVDEVRQSASGRGEMRA